MYCQPKENNRANTNTNINTNINTKTNMSKNETLRTYLQILEDNKRIFATPVMVQTKSGTKQWKATSDSVEIIFTNLKRSIANKSNINELDKLFISITQNKFESSFKLFIKAITNRIASSCDVNIGSCPKIDKYCPKNSHEHTKYFLIHKIITWYINYYEWKNKMSEKKKQEVKASLKEAEVIVEKITQEIPESWETEQDDVSNIEVPDSWEDSNDNNVEVPDSWED